MFILISFTPETLERKEKVLLEIACSVLVIFHVSNLYHFTEINSQARVCVHVKETQIQNS